MKTSLKLGLIAAGLSAIVGIVLGAVAALRRNKLIDRAMAQDFSWNNSARQYEELYRRLVG